MRLTHSIDQCSGIVEVFYGGTWMSVSEHGWAKQHSDLVCKNQACGLSYNHSGKLYMEGEAPVWIKVQGPPKTTFGQHLMESTTHENHNIKVICEGKQDCFPWTVPVGISSSYHPNSDNY